MVANVSACVESNVINTILLSLVHFIICNVRLFIIFTDLKSCAQVDVIRLFILNLQVLKKRIYCQYIKKTFIYTFTEAMPIPFVDNFFI